MSAGEKTGDCDVDHVVQRADGVMLVMHNIAVQWREA